MRLRRKKDGEYSLMPADHAFTQQRIPGNRFLLTPFWLIFIGLGIGCVFIPVGAVCLHAALSVVEVPMRYDDVCISGDNDAAKEAQLQQLNGAGSVCTMQMSIPRRMQAPVYLYYGIAGFQQNHRRYAKSRSDQQNRGTMSESANSYCRPELYLGGNTSQIVTPCGLIAWSLFNDTFQVSAAGSTLPVDETGITWGKDKSQKFAQIPAQNFNIDASLRGGRQINSTLKDDEHFQVWMRPATTPNFRKLWGRIQQDLAEGTTLSITIDNRYNTYRFGARKYVILSTTSWLGGRNDFLGIAYICVGGSSVLFSAVLFLVNLAFGRTFGDLTALSWNRPEKPVFETSSSHELS